MSYRYYDTPDGEDCFKKLWFTTKYATMIGFVVSTTDVILRSHPKGYFQTASRYVFFTAPLVGMAATYTVTTCVATSLRKRDDYLNPFIGGCATGSVFGAIMKSGVKGLAASLIFGVGALVLKSYEVNKWDFFPMKYPRAYGTVDHYIPDWSLVKERPRTWKRSPDEDISAKN